MVTRKQRKEYNRILKVMMDTYHEKEKGRVAILALFEGIANFMNVIEAEADITFHENNIYHASASQQEFLASVISNFKDVSHKARIYGEAKMSVYEELNNCMEEMSEVCKQLGSEETDKKESEIIIQRMDKRIELSRQNISISNVELNEIISEFDSVKILHNSIKN